MKRFKILAVICGLLVIAMPSTVAAYTITYNDNTVNVGALDALLAQANLSDSGDGTELDWVNDALISLNLITEDAKFTAMDKTELMAGQWYKTNPVSEEDPNYLPYWAFDFQGESPEYFFVKTGNTGAYDHFLYGNLDSFLWGVVDLGFSEIKNIGKISHVGSVGGGQGSGGPVPEPSTLLLLGSGVLGLGILGRKRLSK